MLLQDVFSGTVVCCLALPSTHLMATHCSPVLAFNAKDHTLFIKGQSKQTPVFLRVCKAQVHQPREGKNEDA